MLFTDYNLLESESLLLRLESTDSSRAALQDGEPEDFNNKPKAKEQAALTIASAELLIFPTNISNTWKRKTSSCNLF